MLTLFMQNLHCCSEQASGLMPTALTPALAQKVLSVM